jgi:hypothetical protein
MTAEHLTLLDPNDLRSIRMQCKKCRCSITIQLDQTIRVPTECPSCRETWNRGVSGGGPSATEISEYLANMLKEWRNHHADRTMFSLHFEIQGQTP